MNNYLLFLCDLRNLREHCTCRDAVPWRRPIISRPASMYRIRIHGHFENSQKSLNSGARCVKISGFHVPLYSTRLRITATEKDILRPGCASVAPRQSADSFRANR